MFKVIGRSDPNILCITDYLIGDMSDINYEFLLLDRPIILMSNSWLDANFPDIGVRVGGVGDLHDALSSIKKYDAFKDARQRAAARAFAVTDSTSADVALAAILNSAGIDNPILALHHRNNIIYKSNLMPLAESASKLNIDVVENSALSSSRVINVGAHFACLLDEKIATNYCVHLDHGLKGDGTANVEMSQKDYRKHKFFPSVDLHLTAGQMGQARTEMLLGPMRHRAKIGAYPKATTIINGASPRFRGDVFRYFGLNPDLPVITYASAGELSAEKPGGSLNSSLVNGLKEFASKHQYNVVVKLKYPFYFQRRALSKLRKMVIGRIAGVI